MSVSSGRAIFDVVMKDTCKSQDVRTFLVAHFGGILHFLGANTSPLLSQVIFLGSTFRRRGAVWQTTLPTSVLFRLIQIMPQPRIPSLGDPQGYAFYIILVCMNSCPGGSKTWKCESASELALNWLDITLLGHLGSALRSQIILG